MSDLNSKVSSRRAFIKASAVGLGGIGIAGLTAAKGHALPVPQKWDKEFDVVIVGGGAAGLCAAIEARKAGASVVLLEKEPITGGSSAICGGQFSCAPTAFQKDKGINDSTDQFFKDMMAIGKNKNDPALVRAYVDASTEAYESLKAMGVKFLDIKIYDGFSVPRSHVVSPGDMLTVLRKEAATQGTEIMMRTSGKRLYTNSQGRVIGIKAESSAKKPFNIKAKRAVILATGGFVWNTEMMKEFGTLPLDLGIPVAARGTSGDGHKMGFEVGAGTKNIALGLAPGVGPSCPIEIESGLLCMPNYEGGIVVNKNGKRFVKESINYNDLSTVGLSQPDGIMFMIADDPIINKSPYVKGRVSKKAQTLNELAGMLGLSPEALVAEVEKYNRYVETGNDPEFGRNTLVGISGKPVQIKTPPFYGYVTRAGILSTKGGLSIDKEAHLINVFGEIIPSVYAAGEITGGIHGGGYHTGSQLGKAVVFGRIAGKNAAKEKAWVS
jgi:fumarate reductase flavoprotein subunit